MDLLFSLKDYSPDEFRQGYCEILKFCFSLLIFFEFAAGKTAK